MKFEKVNISNNSVWKYHARLTLLHTSVCCWLFFPYLFFIGFFLVLFCFFCIFLTGDFFVGCIFVLILGVDCIVLIFCALHCIVFCCFFLFLLLLFFFGGGGSLWVCLCCNCVHVIRIDKSDIWPKVKVEYPWISDNVICWIKKARLNMMEAEYIHKHWNTCKIKTQNYTLDIMNYQCSSTSIIQ